MSFTWANNDSSELISTSLPIDSAFPITATVIPDHEIDLERSWVFRSLGAVSELSACLFGIVVIVLGTATLANVPLLQLLSFGYLLEVAGRTGRTGKLRDGLVGIRKAGKIGAVLLGTWLLLLPIRILSDSFWYEAYLIDPASDQTLWLRRMQIILVIATVLHIVACWICGGKLKYFFWPVIAPVSFGLWACRKLLGSSITRPFLSTALGWISPKLTNDICNASGPSDWFLPLIVWRKLRAGTIYQEMRDGLWHFFETLNLWHYFRLGTVGFVGSVIWLIVPTLLLVGATKLQGAAAGLCAFFGIVVAVPVFTILLFLQTHFAAAKRFGCFFEVREVVRNFGRSPLAHLFALLTAMILAVPLFLLKIEDIPRELLWTLSVVFVLFSWPSRIAIAKAYHRGQQKQNASRWWLRWPAIILALPIAATFVLIMFGSRYVSWHGAYSMIENHVFLLPAPFWL